MNSSATLLQRLKIIFVAVIGIGLLATFVYLYYQSQQAAQPQSPAAKIEIDTLEKTFNQMSIRQKLASLLILHTSGSNPEHIQSFVEEFQPGGIILMGDNITSDLNQVASIAKAVQSISDPFPIFIAIDQEGCTVKRLPQDTYPCAKELQNKPDSAIQQAFSQRSELLQKAGINLNFGIVADITDDADSFIYPRVFGSNPQQVGNKVRLAVQASQPTVFATVKHFPGHGQTAEDTHKTIPQVPISYSLWQSHDAIPFKAGIDAGADAIMFSHIIYDKIDHLPASLSSKWHKILREQFDFKGLTITDDLVMLQQSGDANYQDVVSNTIASINAGNSLTLIVNDHNIDTQPQTNININALLDGLESAVQNGQISYSLLNEQAFINLEWRSKLPRNIK